MKKVLLLSIIITFIITNSFSQVAINTTGADPSASAILDLSSDSKGLLIPRMTTNNRTTNVTAVAGLLVYDTDTDSFWYFDTQWIELAGEIEFGDLTDAKHNSTSYYLGSLAGSTDNNYSSNNLGFGDGALRYISDADSNIAMGNYAQYLNAGNGNISVGVGSMYNNRFGDKNTIIGNKAGYGWSGDSYSGCVLIGYQAGSSNGSNNKLFIDNSSTLTPLIGGDFSSNQLDINGTIKITGGSPATNKVLTSDADGLATWETPTTYASELNDLSDAIYDGSSVFLGNSSGIFDDGYNNNVGIGKWALWKNTSGENNVSLGLSAVRENTTGSNNIGIGTAANLYNIIGNNNTAIGHYAGVGNMGTSFSGCVFLGHESGRYNYSDNKLYIDNSSTSSPLIGGDFSTNQVYINGSVKITGGSPGYGKVLTSDADGDASWETKTYGATELNGLSDAITDSYSVFVGSSSGSSDDGNNYMSSFGVNSLNANTSGQYGGAFGYKAAYSNTTGDRNLAIGAYSLYNNSTGAQNTAVGVDAGKGSSGNSYSGCVLLGFEAGMNNTSDNKLFIDNSSTSSPLIGGDFTVNRVDINGTLKITGGTPGSGKVLTSDSDGDATWETPTSYASTINELSDATNNGTKLFMGTNAGLNNTGSYNTGIGYEALKLNSTGTHNTALGFKTLDSNTEGLGNTGLGHGTLGANTTGDFNTAVGRDALWANTTGNYNTAIGFNAFSSGPYSNSTAIGFNSVISGSNQIHLGNTSITEIKGQVSFTTYSDGRIKENIKENVGGLDFILKLRPVTYNINLDKENQILGITDDFDLPNKYDIEKARKTGFIAQEVEAAADETNYDFSGIQKPKNENDLYGLSYSEFVVPLVKGMQEQQQQIKNQQQQIEILNKEISELKALTEKILNQR